MIGKILMILLGVILLALLIALLMPLYVRVKYEGGEFCAFIRYAGKSITLYPGKKSDEERKDDKPKLSKSKDQTDGLKEKNKKPKEKINWEQICYSLDVLPRVLVKALLRTARRICITPLKLHILVAGSDPADTAVLYGKLQGVLASVMPGLHRAVRIEEQDIQLFPDFIQERMDYIADVGIRIRILDVLAIAVFAAFGLLKWYIGFKKRSSKEITDTNQQTKDSAGASDAA